MMGSLDLARMEAACIAPEIIKKVNAGRAAVLARHGRSGMLHGTPTVFAIDEVLLASFREALSELTEIYLSAADAGEDADAVQSEFKGWAAKLREIVFGVAIEARTKHAPGLSVATGGVDGDLRTAETKAVASFGLAIAKLGARLASQPSADELTSAPDLSRLRDPACRAIAETNAREACLCFDAGAYNAATVMAGAALEALLLGWLQGKGEQTISVSAPNAMKVAGKGPIAAWRLEWMIDAAFEMGFFSAGDESLGDALRKDRNLVHPARVLKTGKRLTVGDAKLALAILGKACEKL